MLEVELDLPGYCGAAAPAVAELLAAPLADEVSRGDALRWAALLHDIGKPVTRTERDGWVSFIGHDSVGAEMVAALCAGGCGRHGASPATWRRSPATTSSSASWSASGRCRRGGSGTT